MSRLCKGHHAYPSHIAAAVRVGPALQHVLGQAAIEPSFVRPMIRVQLTSQACAKDLFLP